MLHGSSNIDSYNVGIEHFLVTVVHPDRQETITKYKRRANDSPNTQLRETWKTSFGNEVERLAQGADKTKTQNKNCIFVMNYQQIKEMFIKDKKPTYARIVVDVRTQKEDPKRVRITAGGN